MPTCPRCGNPELTPSRKGGWLCENCGHRLADAPTATEPTTSALDLDALPFPVAYPLAWARDARLASASARLDNTLFAAYQAMRTTGLLLLADYLDYDQTSPRLAAAVRGLRWPHWGEWSVLCDQLARFWLGHFPDDRPTRPPRFPALCRGWLSVSQPTSAAVLSWAPLLADLDGLGGRARSANDAVQKVRNDRVHRTATRTADESADERALTRFLPLVERTAAALFPPGALTLLRVVDTLAAEHEVIRLHGPHLDLRFPIERRSAEWSPSLSSTGVAAVAQATTLPAYPSSSRARTRTWPKRSPAAAWSSR